MGGGAGGWENKSQSSEFRLQERTRLSKLRPVRRISSTSDSLQKYLCGLTSLHGQHLLFDSGGTVIPIHPVSGRHLWERLGCQAGGAGLGENGKVYDLGEGCGPRS